MEASKLIMFWSILIAVVIGLNLEWQDSDIRDKLDDIKSKYIFIVDKYENVKSRDHSDFWYERNLTGELYNASSGLYLNSELYEKEKQEIIEKRTALIKEKQDLEAKLYPFFNRKETYKQHYFGMAFIFAIFGCFIGFILNMFNRGIEEDRKRTEEAAKHEQLQIQQKTEETKRLQLIAEQDRLREKQKQEDIKKAERLRFENEQVALKERKLFEEQIKVLFEQIGSNLVKNSLSPENFIKEYYNILKFSSTAGVLTSLYLTLPKKNQTVLQLYLAGLNKYDESSFGNFSFLQSVSQFYGFAEDCETYRLTNTLELFHQIWSDKTYFLAYLIDSKQYIKKMQEFQKEKILTTDLFAKQEEITAKYTAKMKISTSKSEIEILLKDKETELSRLCLQSDFDKIIEPTKIKGQEYVADKVFSLSIPKRSVQGKMLNLSDLSVNSKIVDDYIVAKKEIEDRLEKQLNQFNDANGIMRAKDSAQKEIDTIVVKNDILYSLYNSKESKDAIDVIGNLLSRDYDQQLFTAILYYASQSKEKKWLRYIHKISFNTSKNSNIKSELIIAIMNKPSSWNLRFLVSNIRLEIAKYVLCSHLIDLYYNASDFDITSSIEFKNDIPQNYNLTAEQKSALLPLVEEIIEKAGRKSKSLTLATEVNVKSKDIEIVY